MRYKDGKPHEVKWKDIVREENSEIVLERETLDDGRTMGWQVEVRWQPRAIHFAARQDVEIGTDCDTFTFGHAEKDVLFGIFRLILPEDITVGELFLLCNDIGWEHYGANMFLDIIESEEHPVKLSDTQKQNFRWGFISCFKKRHKEMEEERVKNGDAEQVLPYAIPSIVREQTLGELLAPIISASPSEHRDGIVAHGILTSALEKAVGQFFDDDDEEEDEEACDGGFDQFLKRSIERYEVQLKELRNLEELATASVADVFEDEEDSPTLREALTRWRPNSEIDIRLLMDTERFYASAEGFCVTVNARGEVDEGLGALADEAGEDVLSIISYEYDEALGHGIDGYESAEDYHKQLLKLPANPKDWSQEEQHNAELILAKIRGAFFGAQQKSWEYDLEFGREVCDNSLLCYLHLYYAARTLVSGILKDAEGMEIRIPEKKLFKESDFAELAWPRIAKDETEELFNCWFVRRESALDKGSFVAITKGEVPEVEHVFDHWLRMLVPQSMAKEDFHVIF